MANSFEMGRLKKIIKNDKRLKRLNEAFDTLPEFNLEVRELYEEIQTLHTVRNTRSLNRRSESFVQDVIAGMLDDQSKRSRLVEIMMACVKTIKNLEETLDSIGGYLQIEYSEHLNSIARTKAERTSFIEHQILQKFRKYITRISGVKEACELVIIDIDKAGYVYKNLIEAIKLSTGRKDAI